MKKLAFCLVCLMLSLFVASCSSKTKTQRSSPPLKLHDLTLSKGIDRQETMAVPLNPTIKFNSQDEEVVALLRFENLSGNYNFRWDWYDPSGKLYYSTPNLPIETAQGKYLKNGTVWHALVLKEDNASQLPGEWEVKAYVNDDLIESKRFSVLPIQGSLQLTGSVVQNPYPKDWGLIIGIERYAHLPNVEYARKDALIIKDYYIKMFGVPEENIIMLIDEDATKARIEGFLESFIPANVDKDTTLYVYFAGHGAPGMENGAPYLVPYDGDTLFIEQTGYELKTLYKNLEDMDIRQAYVFLDSCFSGTASRAAEMLTKGTRPALITAQDVQLNNKNIVSLSASSKGQVSNSYPKKEHGLFTYYLLKGLQGDADADDNQYISIKEIYNYISKHVVRVARRQGKEQTPVITPPLDSIKDVSVGRVLY